MRNDLESVRRGLLVLAALAEDQLRRALTAFFAGDAATARLVIAADADVDALELRVDAAAVAAIAAAPAVHEVRAIVAAMSAATMLERIGAQAAGIAAAALAPHAPSTELGDLARLMRAALTDAVEALYRCDAALARAVIAEERQRAAKGEHASRRILEGPLAGPAELAAAFHAAEVLRRLERVGVHAAGVTRRALHAAECDAAAARSTA
jgi:phosphate transport system protein